MYINWVNHASFVFNHKGMNIICDPWINGTAFNDGWNLLVDTKFSFNDFSQINYIWFSHEHPDHFSPSNLKQIPEEYRSSITVLYQKTSDKKVLKFCKSIGFNIKELEPFIPFYIATDFSVTCNKYGYEDSWLNIKVEKYSILNLNDCPIREEVELLDLKKKIGEIDILLSQFSYANWCGNKGEKYKREEEANSYIGQLMNQIKFLNPKNVIPFASYIYFCHQENFFHNDSINKISNVFSLINKNTNAKCNVLFPGETLKIGQKHDSISSIKKYENEYKSINKKKIIKSQKVIIPELFDSASKYVSQLRKTNSMFLFRIFSILGYVRPTIVYLVDYKKSFIFSCLSGLKETNINEQNTDIKLSSSCLNYCFKNLWGSDTIFISARMETGKNNSIKYFYRNFVIGSENNFGRFFPKDFLLHRIKYKSLKLFKRLKNRKI